MKLSCKMLITLKDYEINISGTILMSQKSDFIDKLTALGV